MAELMYKQCDKKVISKWLHKHVYQSMVLLFLLAISLFRDLWLALVMFEIVKKDFLSALIQIQVNINNNTLQW